MRTIKFFLKILLSCVVITFISGIVFAVNFDKINWRSLVEKRVSTALGRVLTIDNLQLGFHPLSVKIDGLQLANAKWGSAPDIITIEHFYGELDGKALVTGILRYRHLKITGLHVTLERNAEGVGNWKFFDDPVMADNSPARIGWLSRIALVPKNRGQFPSILDGVLSDINVRIRTSSGVWLALKLNKTDIASSDDYSPVRITLEGLYNNVPATGTINMHSFSELRDAHKPYGMDISLSTSSDNLHFIGTMTEPLDIDGVDGRITLSAPKLDEVLALGGVAERLPITVSFQSILSKKGDDWHLLHSSGYLLKDRFFGNIFFHEGARRQPDATTFDLHFPLLRIGPIFAAVNSGGAKKTNNTVSILPAANPSTTVDGTISVAELWRAPLKINNFTTHFGVQPSQINLWRATGQFAGGVFSLQLFNKAVKNLAVVTSSVGIKNLNICRALTMLHKKCQILNGDIDMQGKLNATGPTADAILRHIAGRIHIDMQRGVLARDALEKISEDVRILFRHTQDDVPIGCMRADAKLKDGIATFEAIKLATSRGDISGGGVVDLLRRRQDLIVGTNPESTGIWALDIPLNISGTFEQPRVRPVPRRELKLYLAGNGC